MKVAVSFRTLGGISPDMRTGRSHQVEFSANRLE